jgi:hypothetical protein
VLLIAVTGPAGSGKSTTLVELAAWAAAEGLEVDGFAQPAVGIRAGRRKGAPGYDLARLGPEARLPFARRDRSSRGRHSLLLLRRSPSDRPRLGGGCHARRQSRSPGPGRVRPRGSRGGRPHGALAPGGGRRTRGSGRGGALRRGRSHRGADGPAFRPHRGARRRPPQRSPRRPRPASATRPRGPRLVAGGRLRRRVRGVRMVGGIGRSCGAPAPARARPVEHPGRGHGLRGRRPRAPEPGGLGPLHLGRNQGALACGLAGALHAGHHDPGAPFRRRLARPGMERARAVRGRCPGGRVGPRRDSSSSTSWWARTCSRPTTRRWPG